MSPTLGLRTSFTRRSASLRTNSTRAGHPPVTNCASSIDSGASRIIPFCRTFLETTGDHYGADMGRVDYISDAEGARQTINHWVQEQTRNKIKDLLPPGQR